MTKTLRIGDVLLQSGYIKQSQIDEAIALQSTEKKRLGEILIDKGYITTKELGKALSARLNLPLIELQDMALNPDIVALIPRALCEKYKLIAIDENETSITIAVADPLDFYAIEDVKSFLNKYCNIVISYREQIDFAISSVFSEVEARSAAHQAKQSAIIRKPAAEDFVGADDVASPIVNLVNSILSKAYSENASDVHFEPFETIMKIRLRIDGQLLDYLETELDLAPQITSRIKILSDMNIAEKRIPQDGHFKTVIMGYAQNIRVSTIPTIFGEKIVLRFLSGSGTILGMETFGMNEENYKKTKKILKNPYGIIYITGPTGSGKTTTLYTILEKMQNEKINISTIEDPVERDIKNVNQIQVNDVAGLTFATGLRSLLRQDPDVILVGETRDNETAAVSVNAALTGHLVFSTLHTNDAIGAIVRLMNMGVEEYLLANSLAGVIAQRLVKRICKNCKQSHDLTEEEKELLPDVEKIYSGKGCNQCNHTGFKGRIAVHEILEIDGQIRQLIANRSPMSEIYQYVKTNNKLKLINENIADLVKEGVTTIGEYEKYASLVAF